MTRWESSPLNTDFWPVALESAEDALTTISRCPLVETWGYQADTNRIWWTLADDTDRDCVHLKIKRNVQRAVSLHQAQDWE